MSVSDLLLRPYQPSDLELLYRLDQRCFDKSFRFSRTAMKRFVEGKNARVVIGMINDELAGFCIAHIQKSGPEKVAYLITIDVAPERQRSGVGRCLLRALEQDLCRDNCTALMLHVHTGNESAIRFYERENYTAVGTEPDFYSAGVDAFVYRKSLQGASTNPLQGKRS